MKEKQMQQEHIDAMHAIFKQLGANEYVIYTQTDKYPDAVLYSIQFKAGPASSNGALHIMGTWYDEGADMIAIEVIAIVLGVSISRDMQCALHEVYDVYLANTVLEHVA